ncbi:unnamed protein product [Miscanthus lutarioriparius]|uniref:NB-ARC domain-containing protein n=1 Tax=Miscanthus lutarioriparius TaxID=422564 RepID=A0A811PDX0_9POAL|nr:unnamed protein product [Miscanthus lutarioriparius]
MEPLPFEESKKLFYKRVFKSDTCPPQYQDLEVISDGILKKYSGLPLAIVCIGGMLARTKNKTRSEWEKLCDRLGSGLEINPTIGGMRRILSLGYHDLPYYLKACFLYLSVFPEDYEIKRGPLVRRWAAEGFISGMHESNLEEVAAKCLDEFVSRSIVTPTRIASTGLAWSGAVSKKPMPITFAHLKLLRVLDLEGCQWLAEDLKEICKLTLLRYLSLRRTNVGLPKLVGRLKELKSIRHLSIIHWRNRDIGLEVFLELTSPPIFLETLYLWGRLSVLPLWISSLSYLIELCLRENFLDGELLGQLEKLPSLVSLKLYHESFMGTHLCFEKKKLFPSLKKLIIDNAPNLDELRFDGGAPNLESLTLAFEREPANGIFGIENLPKLMEVEFFGETIFDSLVQGMTAEAKIHPNRPRVYRED